VQWTSSARCVRHSDGRECWAVALALVAPIVMALLHQDNLGGACTRPLGVEDLAPARARLILAGRTTTVSQSPS